MIIGRYQSRGAFVDFRRAAVQRPPEIHGAYIPLSDSGTRRVGAMDLEKCSLCRVGRGTLGILVGRLSLRRDFQPPSDLDIRDAGIMTLKSCHRLAGRRRAEDAPGLEQTHHPPIILGSYRQSLLLFQQRHV